MPQTRFFSFFLTSPVTSGNIIEPMAWCGIWQGCSTGPLFLLPPAVFGKLAMLWHGTMCFALIKITRGRRKRTCSIIAIFTSYVSSTMSTSGFRIKGFYDSIMLIPSSNSMRFLLVEHTSFTSIILLTPVDQKNTTLLTQHATISLWLLPFFEFSS